MGATAGIGLGIYNTIQGGKQASDAEDALNKYERQSLKNVTEGLQVSTLGSKLRREEAIRQASGQISALEGMGLRGFLGGFGKVGKETQQVMDETGADLDAQQKQIDQMRAQDEANIRNMQENREIGDISALSSQYNAGKQGQKEGMSQVVQSIAKGESDIKDMAMGMATGGMSGGAKSASVPDMSNPAYQSPIGSNPKYDPWAYAPNPFSIQGPPKVTKR